MADSRFHRLKVADVIAESADARSFVFDLPQALHDAFSYRPGQFLTLKVPCADAIVQRCYSLSSAPGIDRAPKITVKRVRDGRVSNWMCDSIQPGDELDVMAPAGVFTPRSLDGDLLLFAGGSGITPVLSILKSALVNGRGMLTLIYANRDAQSVIFSEELRQLGQRHAGRLRVIHWLDSVQGIPQQRHLEELARPWSMQECFICGPALFMESALAAMLALGLPRAKVHVERFASLPDLPADAWGVHMCPECAGVPDGRSRRRQSAHRVRSARRADAPWRLKRPRPPPSPTPQSKPCSTATPSPSSAKPAKPCSTRCCAPTCRPRTRAAAVCAAPACAGSRPAA